MKREHDLRRGQGDLSQLPSKLGKQCKLWTTECEREMIFPTTQGRGMSLVGPSSTLLF